MSHRACSMPLMAAPTTTPGGKRVPLYISAHRCSMAKGSCPASQVSKSRMTSTTASSGPAEYAWPMPHRPSSVQTFTKVWLFQPACTRKVSIFDIFIVISVPAAGYGGSFAPTIPCRGNTLHDFPGCTSKAASYPTHGAVGADGEGTMPAAGGELLHHVFIQLDP